MSSHFLAAKSSCLNVGGKQVVTQPRNKTKKNHFLEQKKPSYCICCHACNFSKEALFKWRMLHPLNRSLWQKCFNDISLLCKCSQTNFFKCWSFFGLINIIGEPLQLCGREWEQSERQEDPWFAALPGKTFQKLLTYL